MVENRLNKAGLKAAYEPLLAEIRELYTADAVPWIIGYSGGKDSTAILQLVWMALAGLTTAQRTKTVHVISTDTQVENPVVSAWVGESHRTMGQAAIFQGLPITPHQLRPALKDSFWVNLLGRGYPAPRPKFRWCTERLKIRPSNTFISTLVRESHGAILVLGTRKAESVARARTMAKHEAGRVRDRLSPNAGLDGCLVYSPIEDWSNDDVWMFLTQVDNPWGWSNHDLMGMYAGATEGGECPLVVDSSTPSCGDSRFGCWVCTLVDQDKSMAAMIQNDTEKEWMLPLLALRNTLDMRDDEGFRGDQINRDFRRIDGNLTLQQVGVTAETPTDKQRRAARDAADRAAYFKRTDRVHHHDEHAGTTSYLIHGPYLQRWREDFLRQLLEAQTWVRTHGPAAVRELVLVSIEELAEIRRMWVLDKGEIEDSLPRIYQAVVGQPYPGPELDDHQPFDAEALALLRRAAGVPATPAPDARQDGPWLRYELARSLLSLEHGFRTMARRAGLFDAIEREIDRTCFTDEQDALNWALARQAIDHDVRTAVDAVSTQGGVLWTDDPVLAADAEAPGAEPLTTSEPQPAAEGDR